MDVTIKELENIDQISHLYTMAIAMADVMGGAISLDLEELKKLYMGGAFKALIVYAEDQPVGYTVWSEGFHTYDGLFMYIDDIYVQEDYRHSGIGKELMSRLIEIAHKNNYRNIEWLVEKDNDELRRWYNDLGSSVLDKYEYRRLRNA